MKEAAENFAREIHRNQTYNGGDYVDNHNYEVVRVLASFGYSGDRWFVRAMLHDTMEDMGGDLPIDKREDILADKFGRDEAVIVHQVSGFGYNRKTRNQYMYAGEKTFEAKVLKVADRLVNINGPKRDMYVREMDDFMAAFGGGDPAMDEALLRYK